MKKLLTTFLFLLAFFTISSCQKAPEPDNVRYREFSVEEIKKLMKQRAVITTKFGEITLKFLPEVAPNHVENFIELAKSGFYDGTSFHRVIPGFMIQGGCPNSKDETNLSKHGQGNAGYSLKAEFSKRPHTVGTLSMARAQHEDSASSQFFIMVNDAPHLNEKYTVFGEVEKGMEVAQAIENLPRDQRDNPEERVEMTIKIITVE